MVYVIDEDIHARLRSFGSVILRKSNGKRQPPCRVGRHDECKKGVEKASSCIYIYMMRALDRIRCGSRRVKTAENKNKCEQTRKKFDGGSSIKTSHWAEDQSECAAAAGPEPQRGQRS